MCADTDRWMRDLDPQQRQLHMSCGAAAELARLAIRSLGYACVVRTGPVGGYPELLVRLGVGARQPTTAREIRLMSALAADQAVRAPAGAGAIPSPVLALLQQAVNDRGCWLRQVAPAARAGLTVLLDRARQLQDADPARRAELTRGAVSEPPAHGRPDPVSDNDALMVLGTNADTPHDWLRAGRALTNLMLTLADEGLTSQQLGPASNVSATRGALLRAFGDVGFPQLVLRVGYGTGRGLGGSGSVSGVLDSAVPSNHVGERLAAQQLRPVAQQRRA